MCHYGHRVVASGGETIEEKKEMKAMFAEQREQLLAWKIARESDQGVVTEENHNEFVELSRAEWLLVSSSVFPDKTYASTGDLELDGLYVRSEFEECRISTIACFDHVFP